MNELGPQSQEPEPPPPAGATREHVRAVRRRRRRQRILQATAILPSLATVLNALSGFGAIHFATKMGLGQDPLQTAENLRIAGGLIFLAMVFDMLDGRLARMTRRTSDFGAQLDSLSDMVSFGLAPAVMILHAVISMLHDQPLGFVNTAVERGVWCIAAVYVACAALRLARFNVENEADESSHMAFKGLPSPGAAVAVVAFVLLYGWLKVDDLLRIPWQFVALLAVWMSILTLLCGLLMVSRFRYGHLVNLYIRGKKPFRYLVGMVVIIAAVIFWPWSTIAAVSTAYVLSGPIGALLRRWRKPMPSIK